MNENEDDNTGRNFCKHCRREIHLGADMTRVEQGVLGPRGFVPLEKEMLFCKEECLRSYFNGSDVEKLARRVP